jgi:uncharacterized protein
MRADITPRPSCRTCITFLLWHALALSLLMSVFLLAQAFAQNTVLKIPPLTRPVTDLTVTLSVEQASRLEARLREFEARKGSQIAVLIVPTTQPETIDQFAIRVAEQWKIGRARIDDGAILVVAKDDRTVRIEVGYGLEGALNDATSKRIIDEVIVPRFRQGDLAGGIDAGVDRMMRVIEGEPLPAARAAPGTAAPAASSLPFLLLAALAAGGILRALLGRVAGATLTGGLVGVMAWLLAGTALIAVGAGLVVFLFTLIGGGRSALPGTYLGGGMGIPGRGGWGGGGLGGGLGGWGGGGGSFGGGGASGRW